MENEFYNMSKRLMSFRLTMAFITAIFVIIIGSFFKAEELDFKKNQVKATAEIIDFTEYGYPVISYSVDGKEYKVKSRSLIPDAKVGMQFEVEYHKKNPAFINIGVNPLYQNSDKYIILGVIGTLITGYLLYRRKKKARERAFLE